MRAGDNAVALCDPALLAARAGWGAPDDAPVFVVGMPRSGPTPVERVLAGARFDSDVPSVDDRAR